MSIYNAAQVDMKQNSVNNSLKHNITKSEYLSHAVSVFARSSGKCWTTKEDEHKKKKHKINRYISNVVYGKKSTTATI